PQREALPRVVRRVYIAVAIAIAATLVVIECSDLVSPYLVVMSAGTFARWMCWVCLPWLWMAGRWLLRPPAAPHDRAAGWSRPIVVAGVVVIAFYAVATARVNDYFGGNYSGLLVVSRSAFVNNPLVAERSDVRNSVVLQDVGYDGQFMYFAMFDPFLRRFSDNPATYRRVMDAPPYRYGRIGFPLLTLIASGGQWPRFPIVMMWLILCGIGLFAVLLARMAQDAGVTPAVGGLALLIPGFWQSIQLSLPEPIAAATLLAGILCASQRRWWPAAALFAVSMLTRETGIIAIACVLTADAMRGRWRPALLVGASAAGVVLLWRAYVAWTLFPDWGIQGLLFHPPDLGLPFAGIADLWRAVLRGDYHPGVPDMHRAAIAYPLVLMSGFALAVVLAIRLPHAWHVAAVVYGLIAISLNLPAIWVHVSNAQRGTFELFVMLALSALTMRQYSRRLGIAVAAFWAISFLYVFFLGYDAGYIRSVLPLI
ncbi:MAG TPA: hypothetical protein VGY57_03200, partial [Vicinamibacterales bacterium]|nr:hypothetical protein [Vicinamibacterales bacterium]